MKVYYNIFENEQDVINVFKIEAKDLVGYNILFAVYKYEDYNGDAFVLLEKDTMLYEVNGGHYSCYGLERQWIPEETTKEAIKYRLENGSGYGLLSSYKKELLEVLDTL